MTRDINIAAINGMIPQASQFLGETRITYGHGSHVDASVLLAEIHGNAYDADGPFHDRSLFP
jgi:hypothetical protein